MTILQKPILEADKLEEICMGDESLYHLQYKYLPTSVSR